MVPWKIISSAQSLLNFMTALAIFLAPIAAILACDYWVVKKKHIDVPGLYRQHGRYEYQHGINWRAAVAFLLSVTPNLPGYVESYTTRSNTSAQTTDNVSAWPRQSIRASDFHPAFSTSMT